MTDREYIENKVRHAFNQGYDLGFKDGKEKAKSQEPILDKIRAEIEAKLCDVVSDYTDGYRTAIQGDLAIIDKYKAESEQVGNPDRLKEGD